MFSFKSILAQSIASMLLTSSVLMANCSDCLATPKVELSQSAENQELDIKKLSTAFGNFIGRNLKGPGVSFDMDALIAGIREGAEGKPSPMSEEEYEEALTALQEKAFNDVSKQNLEQANVYLLKNSQEKNVVQVESGKLQYEILEPGTGAIVTEHSVPQLNYVGRFIDGTVFGSSEETGAVEISLDQTIPGFTQGLVGMKEGEKRRLYIHPDLAYGTSGPLPPNSLLIFDIQIMKSDITSVAPESDEMDNTLGVAGKELNVKEEKAYTTSVAIGTSVEQAPALPNNEEKKVHTQAQPEAVKEITQS